MLEIVQEILKAEKKAETTLNNAKEKAANIRAEAESRANKLLADARTNARESSQNEIENARGQSSAAVEKSLEEERRKTGMFAETHSAEIDSIVSEIIDLVTHIEHPDA